MSETLTIALVGAIFTALGAALPKLIEVLGGARKLQTDEATQLRKELDDRLDKQDAQIQALSKELDLWKERYFDLRAKFVDVDYKFRALIVLLRAQGLSHVLQTIGIDDQAVPPPPALPPTKPDQTH